MKIKKKSVFFIISGLFVLLIISGLLLKLYLSNRLDDINLRKKLTDFCKETLNKAAKVENVYLDFKGNIVVNNFDLSISSDFNDNINLIKSKRVVFVPKMDSLIHGELIITEIRFLDTLITVHKKFGKSYGETLDKILTINTEPGNIKYADLNKLIVIFENCRLDYREVFRTKKLTISLDRLRAMLNFSSEKISYTITGAVIPYETTSIKSGSVDLEGNIIRNNNVSKSKIKIENFDLSYLNEFNKEYRIAGVSINGGISFDFNLLISEKRDIKTTGKIETNSLNIISLSNPGHNILANKNFNIQFDTGYSAETSTFTFPVLRIYDDLINIPVSGTYTSSKKINNLQLSIKPDKIDLSNLSGYFSPFKNISYEGILDFDMDLNYDYNNQKNIRLELKSSLTGFNANRLDRGKTEKIIKDCNLKLSSGNNNFNLFFNTGVLNSDFSFVGDTSIESWSPLKSVTTVKIESSQVEAGLISLCFKRSVENLYREAFNDSKRGYELIYFLQTPESGIFNNNNISVKYSSKKLLFGENAFLTGLYADLEMNRGFINLKEFKLNGYEGDFSLNFQGFFNRDYPYFELKGSAKNLNMENFTKDFGSKTRVTGTGFIDYDFELNAFRISHLVEQARGTLTISLIAGNMEGSSFQDRFSSFLDKNGYSNIDLNKLDLKQFNVTLRQVGKNFYVNNFILNSDKINFSTYGTYDFTTGLNLNIFPNAFDSNNKLQRIPLNVSGPLLNPEISITRNRETKKMLFFDID